MPSLKELAFLARDFRRVSTGRGYFHQPQGLGAYFVDPRCFYLDLTGKSLWTGAYIDEVPAVYVPAWGRHVVQAIMVLQYGLGCVDTHLLTGDPAALEGVRRVASWIPRRLLREGYLDNRYAELNPKHEFYSNNSALTEGEALSFCVRVLENDLVPAHGAEALRAALATMARNMLLPLERNGTALRRGDDLYFCEFCRKDEYVPLNGWVMATFGLRDYARFSADAIARSMHEETLRTLFRHLPTYLLSNGWTRYDNKGLVCSPFYHATHISLLDALHRLTGEPRVKEALDRSRRAYTAVNRIRYTVLRVAGKLRESTLVISEKGGGTSALG